MSKLFGDTIAAGDGTMCDYHISVNSYDGYQQLLGSYDRMHMSFLWLYVTSGRELIGISASLRTRTIPIVSWGGEVNGEIDIDKQVG